MERSAHTRPQTVDQTDRAIEPHPKCGGKYGEGWSLRPGW